jgi:predicted TIM-barrel fold metal-dependent hydrolase
MRVIDAHVHLYPPEAGREPTAWAAAHGEPHWAQLCIRRRKDGNPVQGFPSVDELLRDMDAAGVAQAVLLGWYWENHTTCVEQNRFYAGCIHAHPDRLAAFATVHPAAGAAALDEIVWAKENGFRGLGELSPHSQHVALSDPVWREVLARAGQLNLPVNLHVTDPVGRKYPGRVETPLDDFVHLAREFPQTKFILAHWGGGLAFDPENRALGNVWYDTAASPLMYGPDVWRRAATAVGVARILFGSDYPLILYPKIETAPAFGGLLGEARAEGASAAVLGGNTVALLDWPA